MASTEYVSLTLVSVSNLELQVVHYVRVVSSECDRYSGDVVSEFCAVHSPYPGAF